MIGGTIIQIQLCENDVWLDVQDTTYPKEFCAIYVARNADSERIRVGDSIWWQGKKAFWTRKDRTIIEKEIPRTSASGVSTPPEMFSSFIF